MNSCPFCNASLSTGPPWAPGPDHRLAFDPFRGRLWEICPQCSRWVLTPLESRWEVLESCEAAVHDRGKVLFSTPHLALVDIGEGELIRVGRSMRPEFVDWRYGPRLGQKGARMGFWTRILSGLPSPPIGGYDPYRGFAGAMKSAPWLASPFLDSASSLTYLFSQVPLSPECPSCNEPLALRPWDFQEIRLLPVDPLPALLTTCGLCEADVSLDLGQARAALRMGLGVVTPAHTLEPLAEEAAEQLDSLGGPMAFLQELSRSEVTIGELGVAVRSSLLISLDEIAEAEALEAEWKKAEEIASIMDGELSHVPGFEGFKRRILGSGG